MKAGLQFAYTRQCPFEWFHYSCVGLTTPPKGKWFCASCLAKRKKLIPSDK